MVVVVGAPPIRGVGRTGGFKFVVEDRGDLGLTDAGAADRQPRGQGQPARGAGRPPAVDRAVERVPRQRAADLRGREPQAVHDDGRAAGRPLRHPANLPGIAVRQRLQPLRPHLAGDRPGRRALPHPEGDGGPTEGPQQHRRHGARGDPGLGQGRQRPLAHQPLQHPRGGLHQRRHRAGHQLPAGNRPDGAAGGQGIAQGHGLRVDRDGVLRGAGGQHGDGHLRRGRVDGLPGAGRAIRELVAALGGDPRGSHVPA